MSDIYRDSVLPIQSTTGIQGTDRQKERKCRNGDFLDQPVRTEPGSGKNYCIAIAHYRSGKQESSIKEEEYFVYCTC